MRSWLAPFALVLPLTACSGALAKDDGRALGQDLGRFHVKASIGSTSCGPNALEAPEQWEFDVVLSRDPPSIYWNTGDDSVQGDLAADQRRFEFSSETVVDMSGSAAKNPCAVTRTDTAEGQLEGPDTSNPTAFHGTLGYAFSTQTAEQCESALIETGLAALPCSMTYDMAAEWKSER